MIVDALIAFCAGIVRVVVLLLPAWGPPSTDGGWGTIAGGGVGILSGYFPIVTLTLCIVFVFGVKILASVWQAVVFLYDRVPFKFT